MTIHPHKGPAHEARARARARDQDLGDKDRFVSAALGLSMYAPSVDEPEGGQGPRPNLRVLCPACNAPGAIPR